MAINKRQTKFGVRYQVKVKGSDGLWITKTFETLKDAQKSEATLKLEKLNGGVISNRNNLITLDEYWHSWFDEVRNQASDGWRVSQAQIYRAYISPTIGRIKLQQVTPALISKVLRKAIDLNRAPQTVKHIYNLLHKMFGDAVELFQILSRNPVLRSLKPSLPEKERKHLSPEDALKLLRHVEGKPYELAIWLGLVAGLRVGETQALRWEHLDLGRGVLHVRSTFVRKENKFRDYPKGKRWHSIPMPSELQERLLAASHRAKGDYVVTAPGNRNAHSCYNGINRTLKRYCREAGVPVISTHELRHSTSAIYLANGATRDDMRTLFAHSSSSVTDRYIHEKGGRLYQVAKVIRLFPPEGDVSQKLPSDPKEPIDAGNEVC